MTSVLRHIAIVAAFLGLAACASAPEPVVTEKPEPKCEEVKNIGPKHGLVTICSKDRKAALSFAFTHRGGPGKSWEIVLRDEDRPRDFHHTFQKKDGSTVVISWEPTEIKDQRHVWLLEGGISSCLHCETRPVPTPYFLGTFEEFPAHKMLEVFTSSISVKFDRCTAGTRCGVKWSREFDLIGLQKILEPYLP